MADTKSTPAHPYIKANDWDEWDEDPPASDRAEKAFLGGCLHSPWLLDFGALLSSGDFRNQHRGVVFDTMRGFPRRAFDVTLLLAALERIPRSPRNGWPCALGSLFDYACLDEELVPAHVMVIKEAAVLRRQAVN